METWKDPHSDRIFYFTGGQNDSGYLDKILRFNPSNGTWTEAGQLTEPKYSYASTAVEDISGFICRSTTELPSSSISITTDPPTSQQPSTSPEGSPGAGTGHENSFSRLK